MNGYSNIAKQVGVWHHWCLPQESWRHPKTGETSKVAFVEVDQWCSSLSIAMWDRYGLERILRSSPVASCSRKMICLALCALMSQKDLPQILLNLFWASIYNIPWDSNSLSLCRTGIDLNPELAGRLAILSSLSVLYFSVTASQCWKID